MSRNREFIFLDAENIDDSASRLHGFRDRRLDQPLGVSRRDFDGMAHFRFRAPSSLSPFVAQKGSVALDGTSLTVNAVEGDEFEILLIPHTLKVTTFGTLQPGARLNIEVDMMARYAARLLETAR